MGLEDEGFDYLAWYVPLHQNGPDAWGIYFHGPRMVRFGQQLRAQLGEPDLQPVMTKAVSAVLHHERFHFLVELFATQAEQVCQRAVYEPYKTGVYRPSFPGRECIEESLANAYSITRRYSTRDLHHTSPQELRDALRRSCDMGPPAYSEYKRYIDPGMNHSGSPSRLLRGYCGLLAEMIRDASLPTAPWAQWAPVPGARFDLGPDVSQSLLNRLPTYVLRPV